MIPNFNKCSNNGQSFQKQNLPNPVDYYLGQGLKLIGNGEWRSTICPFHDDKKPSLRINIVSGGFKCMACGEKGGDVLAFHRKRYEMNFKESCIELGAWL